MRTLFLIAGLLAASPLAFAECPVGTPEFVPTDPATFPPFGVADRCQNGKRIAVSCGRYNLYETNLSPATMQRVKARQARLEAEQALVKFSEGGEWISNNSTKEGFQGDEASGTANYFDELGLDASLVVSAKLKAGIVMVAQDVTEEQVQVCVATTVDSRSLAQDIRTETTGIRPTASSANRSTTKSGNNSSAGKAENYSWPPR